MFASTGGQALDRSLPLTVLIHGAGMDHSVWSLQTRYLAHHGRSVLAVDLPGHGRSGGEPLASIAELADWVPKLIDAAGFEQAALVGHSMGAITALEAATRHPERVRALALLGVAERMPVHPDLLGFGGGQRLQGHRDGDRLGLRQPSRRFGGSRHVADRCGAEADAAGASGSARQRSGGLQCLERECRTSGVRRP